MSKIVDTDGNGDWFRGGLVAYQSDIKFDLLEVPEGPVITEIAARAMASGVRRLFSADIGIATTGVAGPDTEEGVPVGTVIVGIANGPSEYALTLRFEGNPQEIRAAAADQVYLHAVRATESGGS